MTDNNPIKLESMELGGVNTNIIYFEGTNPEMPMVLYHPGIFGQLESLTNIPRIALESGCSFLALNTIDQDPDGTYPPRNIDFDVCMAIIEEGLKQHDTSKGIIPILNSWGSFPITLALQRQPDIAVKGLLTIGATLNAQNVIKAKLNSLFENGTLDRSIQQAFDKGVTIQAPFPNGMLVNVNQDFFQAHEGQISENKIIRVENKIICIHANGDEYVTEKDTNELFAIYKNSAEPHKPKADGGHFSNQETLVGEGLIKTINACHPKFAA